MDQTSLQQSIKEYEAQLQQITSAIQEAENEQDGENLISLKNDLEQLIQLTKDNLQALDKTEDQQVEDNEANSLDDEYSLFMAEIKKEEEAHSLNDEITEELKSLEGMKCKAPHTHLWGAIAYHNAIISSVLSTDSRASYDDIKVKIIFINPTHTEMVPCPYMLDVNGTCKFSDEQCKYSHGEIVEFASLQEYAEPQFELLKVGCPVLAKKSNNLWQRGTVRKIMNERCSIKFDMDKKEIDMAISDTYPLESESDSQDDYDDDAGEDVDECTELINASLMNPQNQAFGEWEQHNRGIGSKLMQKMGYVIGTGLGKNSDGRTDPVSAVILPARKSLDFCMQLRENAGGDKNLFSVERKLKQLKRRQEMRNQKAYERELNRKDVFNFLNATLSGERATNDATRGVHQTKHKHREQIKKESGRSLNVASMQTEEDIKKCEVDVLKLRQAMTRHKDTNSQVHKSLCAKLRNKHEEIASLKQKAVNIRNEQQLRKDRRKLTVF